MTLYAILKQVNRNIAIELTDLNRKVLFSAKTKRTIPRKFLNESVFELSVEIIEDIPTLLIALIK